MIVQRKYGTYIRDDDFEHSKDTGCLVVYSHRKNSGKFKVYYVNTRVATLDYYSDDKRSLSNSFFCVSPRSFWESVNWSIQDGKKVDIDFSECDCFYPHLFYSGRFCVGK